MTRNRTLRGQGLTWAPTRSSAASDRSTSPIYQLKVTLANIRPPIWRRLQVRGDISLFRLHEILQRAMPWTDSHMHQFIVGRTYYGRADSQLRMEILSDRSNTLAEVAPAPRRRFIYEYDFGDSWEHEIVVEKILPSDAPARCPECLAGERACPPDDCGGFPGYEHLLKVLGDSKHPDHEEMREWLGRLFDPEAFDLVSVNRRLGRLR